MKDGSRETTKHMARKDPCVLTNPIDGRVGDTGIMLNPEPRGKDSAYKAIRITIDHTLIFLQLNEVTISMTNPNTAMRGLVDKRISFTTKGIQR